jgi:2-hydroxychromene-2-carboxylate isomerase
MDVEFHFDFGSPNAYLAHRVIPAMEARTGVRFRYVPVLLGGVFKATGNRSPVEAFAGIRNKLAYEQLEIQRFINRYGIEEFRPNPFFPVNTLAIMRGAAAAELDGTLAAYVNAVFHHMWEAPKKMDDPEVIRAALEDSGLDAAAIIARTQDPDVKAKLIANTEQSVARGTFGAPTFFVGNAIWFGKDRLRDVEEAITGGTGRKALRKE